MTVSTTDKNPNILQADVLSEVGLQPHELDGLSGITLNSLGLAVQECMAFRDRDDLTLELARDLDAVTEVDPAFAASDAAIEPQPLSQVYHFLEEDNWGLVRTGKIADGVSTEERGGFKHLPEIDDDVLVELAKNNPDDEAFDAAYKDAIVSQLETESTVRKQQAIDRFREDVSARLFEKKFADAWRNAHPGETFDRARAMSSSDYQRALLASRRITRKLLSSDKATAA